MALVAIQCKNCGGSLQVDSDAKNYYCPHCQTSYAMEQTINQTFQTTNIGTATIIDDGSGKIDQEIHSAEAFLTLRKFENARIAFQDLTASAAHKYRAWWGLARAMTEEFTKQPSGNREFLCVSDALNCADQIAPEKEKAEMREISATYLTRWQSYHDQLQSERTQRFNDIRRRSEEAASPLQEKIKNAQVAIEAKNSKLYKLEKKKNIVPIIAFIAISLLLFFTSIQSLGIITSIIMSALASGIFILLPLKVVFAIIIKAVRVPTELMITHSRREIAKAEAELQALEEKFNMEGHEVCISTRWLDL